MKKKDSTNPTSKVGRPPTGLSRKIPYPMMFNSEEFEYLNRVVGHAEQMRGRKIGIAAWIRDAIFTKYWRADLSTLRKKQGANIP